MHGESRPPTVTGWLLAHSTGDVVAAQRAYCIDAAWGPGPAWRAVRRSVDVQDDLSAGSAVEQGVDRGGGPVPGVVERDLAVEAPVGGQVAQAAQVAGRAGAVAQ